MNEIPGWQDLDYETKDEMVEVLTSHPMIGTYLFQDGEFLHFNHTAARTFGYQQHEVVDEMKPLELVAEDERPKVKQYIQRRLEGKSDAEHFTFTGLRKDGSTVDIEASGHRIMLEGEPAIFGSFIDVTERNRARQKAEDLTWYNDLTNLPNRKYLHRHLSRRLDGHAASPDRLAIMLLEFEGLAKIRDAFGYNLTDSLIQNLSTSLQQSLPDSSLLCHLERDQFGVLLSLDGTTERLHEIAEDIREFLEEPVVGENHGQNQEIYMDVKIGAAVFPDHAETPEMLISRADVAIDNVRDQSGSAFNVYTPGGSQTLRQRLKLSTDIHKALEQDDFFLEYQPIFNLKTDRITGVETLIRWEHPDLGRISPGTFIPIAEHYGQIIEIDQQVLQTACRQMLSLARGEHELNLSVNLSPSYFGEEDLLSRFKQILDEIDFPIDQLELEVTEQTIMEDREKGQQTLQELKDTGLSIAIDDFGVGYSSFRYLRDLPVDTLKIDRSFIKLIDAESDRTNLVDILCSVGQQLDLTVVAEGVETRTQLDYLRGVGCDKIQGFLMSRPRALGELMPLFDKTLEQRLKAVAEE